MLDAASDVEAADVVVAPSRLAVEAWNTRARSIIVEGVHERRLRRGDYEARRLLLRLTGERPTLALPLDQPGPVSYPLERWSVVDRRWKASEDARRAHPRLTRAVPFMGLAARQGGKPRCRNCRHGSRLFPGEAPSFPLLFFGFDVQPRRRPFRPVPSA